MIIPFDRIQITPSIVATNRIQWTLKHCHAQSMSMRGHRSEGAPDHRVQIKAVHLTQYKTSHYY